MSSSPASSLPIAFGRPMTILQVCLEHRHPKHEFRFRDMYEGSMEAAKNEHFIGKGTGSLYCRNYVCSIRRSLAQGCIMMTGRVLNMMR